MLGKFHSIDQNAFYLFRPAMQERLSKENPARFVIDIVEHLNLCDLEACYGGRNKQPYDQALLFYDYASSVFSSRKLEQATCETVQFHYIAANKHAAHDTIVNFCRHLLEETESLFAPTLVWVEQMALFKLGKVSLNGSKIKATSTLAMDSSICCTSCKFSSTSRSILARVISPTTALHLKTSLFSIIRSSSVIVNLGFFSTILASQLSIACASILETTCIIHHCKVFGLLELKRFLT